MKDRVIVGFIAGVMAATAADIANWILFGINFANIRFMDWASVIFLGHLPGSLAEIIVTQATQIVWDGIMGVIFVLLLPKIKSDYLIAKGVMYAITLLLAFRAITVLFGVPPLKDLPLATFLSNILCSIVWGVIVALVTRRYGCFIED